MSLGSNNVPDYASAKEKLLGFGAPTTATVGELGQDYLDKTNGTTYTCTAVNGNTYTWIKSGASKASEISIGSGAEQTTLDAKLSDMEESLDAATPKSGASDPTSSTKGAVGQTYTNTTTGNIFTCVSANDTTGVYGWELTGGPDAGGGSGAGSTLQITFDAAFSGRSYSVTGGGESYSGTVPASLNVSLTVKGTNTTYTIASSTSEGDAYSTTATTGAYYGTITATLNTFDATLALTAPAGSTVVLTDGTTTFNGTGTGSAVNYSLPRAGTWRATATDGEDTTSGTVVVSAEGSYSLTLSFVTIVGVCWNWGSTSTALSRLTTANDPNGLVNTDITSEPVPAVGTGAGSSPFDNLLPWSGMYESNHNGNAVTYRKGESGFSRTANDTVIWIPEYYCKIINDVANSKTYYYSASGSKDGFTKMVGSGKFVGRYKTGAGYYSKSGLAPQVNMTRATCRTQSKAKGGKWRMNDYATWCAYTFLYLVEFADWDSQSKIGRGYVDGNSAAINTGGTDSMTYHTGRAAGTDGKTSIQYRGIEDPTGNVWEFLDGFNANERKVYICTDPSKYADDTTTGYTDTGVTLCESGWIKKLTPSATVAWAFFLPTANGGSETTYIPDYVDSSTGWRILIVGGNWNNASNAGLFQFNANNASSNSNSNIGARPLVYSPKCPRRLSHSPRRKFYRLGQGLVGSLSKDLAGKQGWRALPCRNVSASFTKRCATRSSSARPYWTQRGGAITATTLRRFWPIWMDTLTAPMTCW